MTLAVTDPGVEESFAPRAFGISELLTDGEGMSTWRLSIGRLLACRRLVMEGVSLMRKAGAQAFS